MPVLIQTPVISYTANGSVTSFAYPFQVLNAADLKVYVNAVEVTGGFTKDGIDNASGGNVIFTVAPVAGSIVRLIRVTSITRITDYVEGGAIPAATLDTDFDRAVMMIQELDSSAIKENTSGVIDLSGRRISNVGVPVNANDVVTKTYHDSAFIPQINGLVTAATTQANNSSTFAANSSNSATASAGSASASATSATNSANSAMASAGSAMASASSATDAAISAINAASYSSGVLTGNNVFTGTNKFSQGVGIGTVAVNPLDVRKDQANVTTISVTNGLGTGQAAANVSISSDTATLFLEAWGSGSSRAGTVWIDTVTNTPLVIATNDVERLRIGTSGEFNFSGAGNGTAGQVLTSGGNGAPPTWAAAFVSGTRLPFAQAAAPTGWTQDVSDNADNRMLRVVKTAGNGIGGTSTHSPILMNVVPAHTHAFTSGNMSADHSHTGTSGTESADHSHSSFTFGSANYAGASAYTGGLSVAAAQSGGRSAAHTHTTTTGGVSVNHTHSGSTDNGSSQVNWAPRYIDLIICSKN